MKNPYPGLKPFYFWKKRPFTQWTVTERQFSVTREVPYYGGPSQKEEVVFTSTEQWMMWKKALIMGDYLTAEKIMRWSDPRTVKNLGREVENFDQKRWDDCKLNVVYEGNWLKFTQNPEWAKQLKQVVLDGYFFVEASPFDKVWGIGLNPEEAKAGKEWQGENLLGIALTDVAIALIKQDQKVVYQEDVNYSTVPVCEALQKHLSQFIDVTIYPNIDTIENDFATLVEKFVDEHFAIGEFRHHH